jgi:hypothetical protein
VCCLRLRKDRDRPAQRSTGTARRRSHRFTRLRVSNSSSSVP